ncbi:MAG: DUF3943 domain-containing protein [Myxococcales bacterium]|nr:DUF3943 domain-containing protein [Myxococcales bacterium]
MRSALPSGLLAFLLLAPQSGRAAPAQMRGSYLGEDGLELKLGEEYDLALGREPLHLWRAIGWQAISLGIGTVWYWGSWEANSADWDFPPFRDRFDFSAVRTDTNHYTINNLTHPIDGAAYYALARINGFGVPASALTSMLTSTIWEYALEYREQVSINDEIFTPGAGVAMGEAMFRLAHYLNSAPAGGRWPQKVAAATVGFPVWLHRWLDDRVPPVGPTDSLGFSGAYHHRFCLAYDRAAVRDGVASTDDLHGFRIEAELNALPGYLRPGDLDLIFTDGNFTEFIVRALWTGDGEDGELLVHIDSTLAGYYTQSIEGPPEAPTGTAARMGVTIAFDHDQRWLPDPRDRISAVHMPGLDGAVFGLWRGLRGRLRIALHPTFNAIDSLAFPAFRARDATTVVRNLTERRGYYFGFGVATWLEFDAEWQGLRLDGRLRYLYVDSLDGVDRFQERIDVDVPMTDDLIEYEVALGYTVPVVATHLRVGYTRTERRGWMAEARAARSFDRVIGTAGFQF